MALGGNRPDPLRCVLSPIGTVGLEGEALMFKTGVSSSAPPRGVFVKPRAAGSSRGVCWCHRIGPARADCLLRDLTSLYVNERQTTPRSVCLQSVLFLITVRLKHMSELQCVLPH